MYFVIHVYTICQVHKICIYTKMAWQHKEFLWWSSYQLPERQQMLYAERSWRWRKDIFTYVSTNGKSVVDYTIAPYNKLFQYEHFEVKLVHVSKIIACADLQLSQNSKPPDHSLLQCSCQLYWLSRMVKTDHEDPHDPRKAKNFTDFQKKYTM